MTARCRTRRGVALLMLGGLVLLLVGAVSAEEPSELSARAFQVRYKQLSSAAQVVGPVLSADGTVTLRPQLGTLVVEDRLDVLDRVADLLESFDLPPRNVAVTLSLFLGSDQRENPSGAGAPRGGFSAEVRGVIETLGDFTRWTSYESLGSRSVTGAEGDRVIAKISPSYRVMLTIGDVDSARKVVKFRRVVLQRIGHEEDGSSSVENLYATGMVLSLGKLHVVGAASGPDSDRALFLSLQAEAR